MRATPRTRRRGAVTAEAAVVTPVFLLLVLGVLDLAVGVIRQAAVSQAAREGARHAIVHGSLAPAGWRGGPWGPAAIDEPLTATGTPVVALLVPSLAVCPADATRVRVEWPAGANRAGSPVKVTVTTTYRPVLTLVLGDAAIPLTASSTMPIAH